MEEPQQKVLGCIKKSISTLKSLKRKVALAKEKDTEVFCDGKNQQKRTYKRDACKSYAV